MRRFTLIIAGMCLLPPAGAQQNVQCPSRGPLAEDQLTQLARSVPAPRLEQLVKSCGIEFEPAGEVLARLRSAGMSKSVLEAVRAATGPAERKRREDQAAWDAIQNSQNPQVVERFLLEHPASAYEGAARQRLAVLKPAVMTNREVIRLLRASVAETDIIAQIKRSKTNFDTSVDSLVELSRAGATARLIMVMDPSVGPSPEGPVTAGTKKNNPKDGLTYVWIPPGTFLMGCSEGDSACRDNEKPAHRVTLTKGFWMAQTEVTQAAYERVTGTNPSRDKGSNLPVTSVKWQEATRYCAAIGGRLPTEAEWEYAARAGSEGPYYGEIDRIAWYGGNSATQLHAVAQKEPNRWGLYDMLGNASEWTADVYGDYQPNPAIDPSGPVSGASGVLRSGSAGGRAEDNRVSTRFNSGVLGLRCAWSPYPVRQDAAAYVARALLSLQQNDTSRALQDCQKAIELDPRNATAHYYCGEAVSRVRDDGSKERALAYYTKAIGLNSSDPMFYMSRGHLWLYGANRDIAMAIADITRAIELEPTADRYEQRALLHASLRDFKQSVADNSQAIELNPKNWRPYTNRASGLVELKQLDRGLEDYSKCIELRPDPVFYRRRAAVYVQLKNFRRAIEDLDKAIEMNPKESAAYRARGDAKMAMGDVPGADIDYAKALLAPLSDVTTQGTEKK